MRVISLKRGLKSHWLNFFRGVFSRFLRRLLVVLGFEYLTEHALFLSGVLSSKKNNSVPEVEILDRFKNN